MSAPTAPNPYTTTADAVPARRAPEADRTAIRPFQIRGPEAPRSWAEWTFGNLVDWSEVDKGGHFDFAAWKQPDLLAAELREAFGPLR
ncbi:MAG: multidrug transporter [Streptosporangiaceae bacterium]|nr:multidrug transporter [Streptosporangiaceae bacterium]